jgi:hypothetical protein
MNHGIVEAAELQRRARITASYLEIGPDTGLITQAEARAHLDPLLTAMVETGHETGLLNRAQGVYRHLRAVGDGRFLVDGILVGGDDEGLDRFAAVVDGKAEASIHAGVSSPVLHYIVPERLRGDGIIWEGATADEGDIHVYSGAQAVFDVALTAAMREFYRAMVRERREQLMKVYWALRMSGMADAPNTWDRLAGLLREAVLKHHVPIPMAVEYMERVGRLRAATADAEWLSENIGDTTLWLPGLDSDETD